MASRLEAQATTPAELVRLMSGVDAQAQRDMRSRATAEPVLTVDGIRLAAGAEPISLTLRAGELVGLAGLEGQGQEAFLKTLRGVGSSRGRST